MVSTNRPMVSTNHPNIPFQLKLMDVLVSECFYIRINWNLCWHTLFQLLHKLVDALHLSGNVDALRAVGGTLAAADTVVGLTQTGNGAVVADEESATLAAVLGVGQRAAAEIALRQALIEVGEDGGDVQPVGTGHAILAGGAGYGIEAEQFVGNLH